MSQHRETRRLKRFFRRHAQQPGACFKRWARAVASARVVVGPQEMKAWAKGWLERKGLASNA